MGSSYGILKLSCKMLLICIIIAAPHVDAAITCPTVAGSLMHCVNYLVGGGTVPPQCCTGVKKLKLMARTKTDRQVVCNCLKNAGRKHPVFNFNRAKVIPGQCGVNIGYNINSPNPNCSTVQ